MLKHHFYVLIFVSHHTPLLPTNHPLPRRYHTVRQHVYLVQKLALYKMWRQQESPACPPSSSHQHFFLKNKKETLTLDLFNFYIKSQIHEKLPLFIASYMQSWILMPFSLLKSFKLATRLIIDVIPNTGPLNYFFELLIQIHIHMKINRFLWTIYNEIRNPFSLKF